MKRILPFLLITIFISCNSSNKEAVDIPFSKVLACTFSEIAYCTQPQDTINKYLPGWKITWNPEPVNGNYAFAAINGNKIVIAIRGSVLQFTQAAFDNWIKHDFNVAVQRNWSYTDSTANAKVSQGVYEAWQNMQNLKDRNTGKSLWQFLDSAVNKNSLVLITGHSLGGNLATVYGSWLATEIKKQNKAINKLSIITFAAPAAGNEGFVNDFNKKIPGAVRVENSNDIVPKFPVANAVGNLSSLYKPSPAAKEIEISFSFISIKLATIFDGLRLTLKGMEAYNGNSVYTHPTGEYITIKLSGKNKENLVEDFFSEAAYQHSIEQYAAELGASVIKCK